MSIVNSQHSQESSASTSLCLPSVGCWRAIIVNGQRARMKLYPSLHTQTNTHTYIYNTFHVDVSGTLFRPKVWDSSVTQNKYPHRSWPFSLSHTLPRCSVKGWLVNLVSPSTLAGTSTTVWASAPTPTNFRPNRVSGAFISLRAISK